MLFFTWRMASKGLSSQQTPKIPKKGLKSANNNTKFSLFYFKAKNEEKLEKHFFLLFLRSKAVFVIFENKKIPNKF